MAFSSMPGGIWLIFKNNLIPSKILNCSVLIATLGLYLLKYAFFLEHCHLLLCSFGLLNICASFSWLPWLHKSKMVDIVS